MKKRIREIAWAAPMVLALVCLAGCGCREKVANKAMEKVIEHSAKAHGQDVKVDLKSGSMSIKSKGAGGNVDVQVKDGKTVMKSDEGGKKVEVAANGDSFTATSTENGGVSMVSGKNAKVPDNFPKDIPVYAGATVVMATSAAEKEMFMLQLETKDTVAAVSDYYKKELEAKGWSEAQSVNQEGDQPMRMLNVKKDERAVTVVASGQDGKTQISIQTSKE